MPAALPVPLRQQILQRHQRGQSAPDIAWELGLPALTVRSLLRRLKDRGPAALAPSYRRAAPDPSPPVQQAIDCRRLHPSWGAQYIRTRLLRRQPDLPLPRTPTLLRHFARLGLTPPPPPPPPPPAAPPPPPRGPPRPGAAHTRAAPPPPAGRPPRAGRGAPPGGVNPPGARPSAGGGGAKRAPGPFLKRGVFPPPPA